MSEKSLREEITRLQTEIEACYTNAEKIMTGRSPQASSHLLWDLICKTRNACLRNGIKVAERAPDETLFHQCEYVTPHGSDGYLCCSLEAGHSEPHRTVYDDPQPTRWMLRSQWLPIAYMLGRTE